MELLTVQANRTGIPLERLLSHPLVSSLLVQAVLPALGRSFSSATLVQLYAI